MLWVECGPPRIGMPRWSRAWRSYRPLWLSIAVRSCVCTKQGARLIYSMALALCLLSSDSDGHMRLRWKRAYPSSSRNCCRDCPNDTPKFSFHAQSLIESNDSLSIDLLSTSSASPLITSMPIFSPRASAGHPPPLQSSSVNLSTKQRSRAIHGGIDHQRQSAFTAYGNP